MVLPLIPLALIAVGAVTGTGGVALVGKGAWDIKTARERIDAARKHYEERRGVAEKDVEETNGLLEALGGQQQRALADVVVRMTEFLRRHERQVRENERLLVDGIEVSVSRMASVSGIDIDAVGWLRGATGSVAAGYGVSTGVTAAAGYFGVASTGTAISGLSGAAAESATMAFLGGGSLAAGGGGVALGATALNFVTIGPGLLIGGLVTQMRGAKATTKAREIQAKIEIEITKLDELAARLEAVRTRVGEVSSVLSALAKRGIAALDILESEPFEPQEHVARFQRAMVLAVAVRDMVAVPVVDNDGKVTDESSNMKIKYRAIIDDMDEGA